MGRSQKIGKRFPEVAWPAGPEAADAAPGAGAAHSGSGVEAAADAPVESPSNTVMLVSWLDGKLVDFLFVGLCCICGG